jgi:hypothetical protein
VVGFFAWSIAFFYIPGKGFTSLIGFGGKQHARYIPEVRQVNHYEAPDSGGYDSQWYVQIALRPNLSDPVLKRGVDSLPYRARRILFEWTAWLLGAGRPSAVMAVFAAQNIACWGLLALLLFRWFPPTDWQNVLRWSATLFSFGLIFSVRDALLDGPSLLVAACGMALIESGRLWWGAAVMGISGLGKDTSILCGAALPPPTGARGREWVGWVGRGAVLALPLLLWFAYIRLRVGHADDIGARNFAAPFAGLCRKLEDITSSLLSERLLPLSSIPKLDAAVAVGLLAQFFFFAFRVRWRDAWWRVGAAYAALMMFLGDAVWENYPSAAARVLLPMTLAFNVSVPRRGKGWLVLLLVGNLGIFASMDLLRPPGRESFVVYGPKELRINPRDGSSIEAVFGAKNWWDPERSRWTYFRWSLGDSTIALRNPMPFAVLADIRFSVRAVEDRDALISLSGKLIRREHLRAADVVPVTLKGIRLAPGDTVLGFGSNRPPAFPGNGDPRRLTYMVRDFEIDVTGRAP